MGHHIPGKIISKEVKEGLLLYDTEADAIHALNGTAKNVYLLAVQGRSLTDIEQDLRQTYSLKEGHNLAADVRDCFNELQAKGLISGTS